ncbi:MAG: DNA repair protein RadA [Bacteroidetes bacterium]|nr:DNA repair protein RadA [Bacteroidota bacterium]
MAKTKTLFFCRNCGHESPKWLGKCPGCGEWNTFAEETVVTGKSAKSTPTGLVHRMDAPTPVREIESSNEKRLDTGMNELNRVLGGGLVPGSLVLIGGEPGIGKSTLMLQVSLKLAGKKVLYVSGEESRQQIRMRADRIGISNDNCLIYTEVSTSAIIQQALSVQPDMLVVDSIQTLQSEQFDATAGSITQIRESAAELNRLAKSSQIPVVLIGHITKDGVIAGPKILEHMVDTVIQFEGDRHYGFRILRAIKNRFGPASELGIFEMLHNGLREVTNPSELLLSQREKPVSGTSIAAMIEGLRPMMVETQALVGQAAYGTPQRSVTGYDLRRLNMLLAVLEKRAGMRLGSKDVFLNIAGGLRVDDPAIDLAVVAALISSANDIPLPEKTAFAAEVGLSGEIRAVNRVEARISEASRLGFEEIYVSRFNQRVQTKQTGIQVITAGDVNELLGKLFG